MTTNQTIDGVPRELLEQFLAGGRQCDRDKLRALLDAPAQPSGDPVGSFDKHMQYMHENIELKKRISELESAQPQGEPVAWMYRREGGECLGQLVQMESDNLKDVREGKVVEGRRILWPRDDYTDWKPLYAEQPAPVAAPPTCCGSCPSGCVVGAKP